MKLRQTLARSCRKPQNGQTNIARSLRRKKKTSGSASDDDTSFEEVTPFSPMCDENDYSDEEEIFSRENANNESDEEYVPEISSPKPAKTKTSNGSNTTKTSSKVGKKQKQVNLSQTSDGPIDVADLKMILGNIEMASFKGILQELPEHFADEYCRYLFALQEKNSSSPHQNIPHSQPSGYCSKAFISSSHKCVICGKKFSSARQLKRHVIAEHETPQGYNCTSCDKLFKTLALFNHHVTFVHSTSHQCLYCDESFEGMQRLNDHIRTAHSCKHRFMCTLCKRGFSRGFQLMMHINVHTGLTPHKCKQCPKAYTTADSLREHERLHYKDKFHCDKCTKIFHTQKLLNLHALWHGTERRFKCNVCERAFKTPQHLFNHRATHNDDAHQVKRPRVKSKKHVVSSKVKEDVKSESGDNVTSQDDKTESLLFSTDNDLNQQPLNLEKTIFEDFEMECDSDEDEVVYQLL
ncbi:zinc finger protein 568-like [Thrips palmi]|uniref:Zinc finger protein 568-like n=1 Tax=Thrips palmi TaxID=161013 RepID=A0A6P8YF39_THRPL|nr:zinc finger protein 568-like [Thrips palmi]